MNIRAKFGGFVVSIAKAATHEQGQYSPDRTFKSVVLGMLMIAGAAMTAMFLYHGVVNPKQQAEYIAFGSGLGALTGGGGLGAWLHSKAKEATA